MAVAKKTPDANVCERKLMRDIFTLSLIASTIRLATPLVLAALGGLFSERSGVINIALEGKMLAGAFTAAAVTHAADTRLRMGNASPWVGLLAGMLAGLFIAVIYAVSCIKFKADQVVSGAAINILMIGMPGFLSGAFFLSSGSTPQIPKDHLLPQSPIVIAIAILALVAADLVRALQHAVWTATQIGRRKSRGGGCGGCECESDQVFGRAARRRTRGPWRRISFDWPVVIVY